MRSVPGTMLVGACLLTSAIGPTTVVGEEKIPVIVDTDIGTYIDDAFALSLVLADDRFQLLGVTTCAAGAKDRAWIVCRLLTSTGRQSVPVAAGAAPQPESEIDWQIQYRRHPAVVWNRTSKPVDGPAEELMQRLIAGSERPVTILALGPLTNVARLLEKHPQAREGVKQIVLMGGSLNVGYDGDRRAVAEWNIASDIQAAQTVFNSGVPLVVTPLDATFGVRLSDAELRRTFAAHTPLAWELQSLVELWRTEDKADEPVTMFDSVAARLAVDTTFCPASRLRLQVDDQGMTRVVEGEPNALVAGRVDSNEFTSWYVNRVASHGEAVLPHPAKNRAPTIERHGLPRVVHAWEDYDNDIEKRWWMTGKLETKDLPPGSRRAQRAVLTQDYDDKMGDRRARYKAVIFNPVPGPPMGPNTRLSFRYKISGTDTIRVQLFSLSNGYHRYLSLSDLPRDTWAEATVDMTRMRRPDGSGGPLARDERIDDIQFYIDPRAELVIDEMILYEAAPADETRPFPKRILFTGWFDTGKQGNEWPGDFEIVPHEQPRTWKAAKSVLNEQTGRPWIRLHLRGQRRLAPSTNLRFFYRLAGAQAMTVALVNSQSQQRVEHRLKDLEPDGWDEVDLSLDLRQRLPSFSHADEIHFLLPENAALRIDDVLLYEP